MNSLPSLAPCNAVAFGGARPIRTIHIGHFSTHPSHSVRVYRGMLFCDKCGSRCIVKLRGVAPWREALGTVGVFLLEAINNQKVCNRVGEWPNPSHIHAGTANVSDPDEPR